MPPAGQPKRYPKRAARTEGDDDVGPRLREHRESQQLSLREVARRLDISPSALSQIETGKSRPSVSTLYAIVSTLGISLDELFGGQQPPAPRRSSKPRARAGSGTPVVNALDADRVQRLATRHRIELESGVRWERLTAQPDSDADFLYVVYEPGGSSSPNDLFMRHAGREYGLVLTGTLEVTVGFEAYDLGPGDSISFDSTIPHRLRNTGTEPVTGVWLVIGRSGDDRNRGFVPPAD
jgi:transcriptional regulator with XRE-family HTH domain